MSHVTCQHWYSALYINVTCLVSYINTGTVWATAIFAVHVNWLHSPPKWDQSVPSRAVNGILHTQNSEQVHDMYIQYILQTGWQS